MEFGWRMIGFFVNEASFGINEVKSRVKQFRPPLQKENGNSQVANPAQRSGKEVFVEKIGLSSTVDSMGIINPLPKL